MEVYLGSPAIDLCSQIADILKEIVDHLDIVPLVIGIKSAFIANLFFTINAHKFNWALMLFACVEDSDSVGSQLLFLDNLQ